MNAADEMLEQLVKNHLKLEGELADQQARVDEFVVTHQNAERIADMKAQSEQTAARLAISRADLINIHQARGLPIPDDLIRSTQQ